MGTRSMAIASWISTVRLWLISFWPWPRKDPAAPDAVPLPAPPDESRAARVEDGGRADPDCKFIHLEDLLEQIPICQKLLKALKRQDDDAYEYHRRLGARLLSDTGGAEWGRLSDQALQVLPMSGLVYLHERVRDDDSDQVPMMIYFNKQAVNIWSNHGTAYRVVLAYWARFRPNARIELKRPYAIGGRYTVVVASDGQVLAVPEHTLITQRINHHDSLSRQTGQHVTTLSQSRFDIPRFVRVIYDDVRPTARDETIEQWAGGIASWAINAATAGLDAQQFMVIAKRNGVAVRFDVGLENPKRFFKDRSCELAVDGKRKRIIHWVEAFDRQLRDGRTVRVRGHFRGLTDFTWNGSEVSVLMPGNRFDPRRVDIGVTEFEDGDPIPPGTIGSAAVAERLAADMLKHGAKDAARRPPVGRRRSPAPGRADPASPLRQ